MCNHPFHTGSVANNVAVFNLTIGNIVYFHAHSHPFRSVNMNGWVVHHGGEYDCLECRPRLITIGASYIAIVHFAIGMCGGIDGKTATSKHISRLYLHQNGTAGGAADTV